MGADPIKMLQISIIAKRVQIFNKFSKTIRIFVTIFYLNPEIESNISWMNGVFGRKLIINGFIKPITALFTSLIKTSRIIQSRESRKSPAFFLDSVKTCTWA